MGAQQPKGELDCHRWRISPWADEPVIKHTLCGGLRWDFYTVRQENGCFVGQTLHSINKTCPDFKQSPLTGGMP